jgi:hypothetical protein
MKAHVLIWTSHCFGPTTRRTTPSGRLGSFCELAANPAAARAFHNAPSGWSGFGGHAGSSFLASKVSPPPPPTLIIEGARTNGESGGTGGTCVGPSTVHPAFFNAIAILAANIIASGASLWHKIMTVAMGSSFRAFTKASFGKSTRSFWRFATSSTCFFRANWATLASRWASAVFRCSSASLVCSFVRSVLALSRFSFPSSLTASAFSFKSFLASSRTLWVSTSVLRAESALIFSFCRLLSRLSAVLNLPLVRLFQTVDHATAPVISTYSKSSSLAVMVALLSHFASSATFASAAWISAGNLSPSWDDTLFWFVTGAACVVGLFVIIAGILIVTFKPPSKDDILNEISSTKNITKCSTKRLDKQSKV